MRLVVDGEGMGGGPEDGEASEQGESNQTEADGLGHTSRPGSLIIRGISSLELMDLGLELGSGTHSEERARRGAGDDGRKKEAELKRENREKKRLWINRSTKMNEHKMVGMGEMRKRNVYTRTSGSLSTDRRPPWDTNRKRKKPSTRYPTPGTGMLTSERCWRL